MVRLFTDEGSFKLPKRLKLFSTLASVNESDHLYCNKIVNNEDHNHNGRSRPFNFFLINNKQVKA